jgi:hypothetical protein
LLRIYNILTCDASFCPADIDTPVLRYIKSNILYLSGIVRPKRRVLSRKVSVSFHD